MKTMSFSKSQQHLAELLDWVVNDIEQVIVTREGMEPAVILSELEYESLKSTVVFTNATLNQIELRKGIEILESGKGETHPLIETN